MARSTAGWVSFLVAADDQSKMATDRAGVPRFVRRRRGAPYLHRQSPSLQTPPAEHFIPQLPQLSASDVRSTQ